MSLRQAKRNWLCPSRTPQRSGLLQSRSREAFVGMDTFRRHLCGLARHTVLDLVTRSQGHQWAWPELEPIHLRLPGIVRVRTQRLAEGNSTMRVSCRLLRAMLRAGIPAVLENPFSLTFVERSTAAAFVAAGAPHRH